MGESLLLSIRLMSACNVPLLTAAFRIDLNAYCRAVLQPCRVPVDRQLVSRKADSYLQKSFQSDPACITITPELSSRLYYDLAGGVFATKIGYAAF